MGGMNHYFTVSNVKGSKVFLPFDSVLKDESNPPATTSGAPAHSFNTGLKDKHNVQNVDPEDTLHLLQQLNKQESQSATQFFSEHSEQHKKVQVEAAKRQENQHSLLELDFDEQKRLYEEAKREAQRASKQKQQSQFSNSYSSAFQYGERKNHKLVQGSNVDFSNHFNARQQQFFGPQVVQQQGQSPSYQHQNTSHHQSQSSSQLSHPQPYHPHMTHISRAEVAKNLQHHNPPNYSNVRGHGTPQQRQHQYEAFPVPDLPVTYSQQLQQHHNLGSNVINPYNLKVGSMILHGNSPAHSGTIKWIGYLPETNVFSAGIEMVRM